jgi:hypothetical protein
MIRSLETSIERWILKLRLLLMAPLLILLIAAPPSSVVAEEKEEGQDGQDEQEGFLDSMLPDARNVHRVKTAEAWSYTKTFRELAKEFKDEKAEGGEPNPYSPFDARNVKLWRPKKKGKVIV